MNTIQSFQYIYSNIFLYQFRSDWVEFGMYVWGGVVMMVILFFLFRNLALIGKAREEDRAFDRKKRLLDDLVMMKDIQTELEKEIEQAILKAAFHS